MKRAWLTALPVLTLLARYLLLVAVVAVAIVACDGAVDCLPVDELPYWRDKRR